MVNLPFLDKRELNLELQLLLALSAKNEVGLIKDLELQQKNIRWDYFLELVAHHRLHAVISDSCRKIGINWIPVEVRQLIDQKNQSNTFQMLKLTAEMNIIAQLFSIHNLPVLMLKGPILAEHLYGDISMRTSKDLDILIPIEVVDQAELLLIEQGYINEGEKPRILSDWKWRHHHISLIHPQKGIQIELHWQLEPGLSNEPSFNELWSRRQSRGSGAYTVYFPSDEDLFYYLLTHGARHGWFRLRWLVDIDRYFYLPMDSKKLMTLLEKHDALAIGGQAVQLTASLFGSTIPVSLSSLAHEKKAIELANASLRFIKEIVHLCPVPATKELKKDFRKYNSLLNTFKHTIVSSIIHMLPSSYDAALLPLPKQLHFLYYPLRPVLWLWRRVTGHKITEVQHNARLSG